MVYIPWLVVSWGHYKLAFTQSKLAFAHMLNAATHYSIDYPDLSLILALVRGGTLARAATLLRVDVSTVFRAVRRLEAALGQTLFEKAAPDTCPRAWRATWRSRRSVPNKRCKRRASVWSRAVR